MPSHIENLENTKTSNDTSQRILLEAINVSAGYKNRTILKDLNLTIHSGEIYALLGVNGAGKTTTLSLFLGFIQPSSGQVLVNQVDVVSSRIEALQHIAYIPESVALYEHLSAIENIRYFLELSGQHASTEEITRSLIKAGLQEEAIDKRVTGFSKGMRQKVVIGLALIRKVPVLLLDEPTSGLDPKAANEFNHLLKTLRNQNVAILMVTHDLFSATEIADRIGFIANGKLAEEILAVNDMPRFDIKNLYQRYTGWANS
ncbi:ABC transporter ATP-binding protein [Acinetobacter stercoris]|uniref:Putative ABC transporter ATP-binding protein YbhF n=1 Tax=Acinetobacter stercoris TaxID=2126983 RepID=A0A2U3MX64_9GAMM|nr:ABC transporter ATP-binding protein [Acinetobacter stercoris]SPL70027.1 putative ABC transporter ATP-binding protein YbhF [Acinetobacter stercoris]